MVAARNYSKCGKQGTHGAHGNYNKSNKYRLLVAVITCGLSILPALGCAGGYEDEFSWSTHPDYPMAPYTKGRLGIVLPTFECSYLVIAYRYFSGKGLNAQEADAAKTMLEQRNNREDTSCTDIDQSAWLEARKAVPGTKADMTVETTATYSSDSPTTVCNIQTNAFITAAKTLHSMIAKFGVSSPEVKEWTKAQDMVFDSGTGQKSIPEPLQAGDKLLQQNRAYQIAAAKFYSMNYDDAMADFSKIAQDTDSPWAHISRYLAVRSLIRKATVTKNPFDNDLLAQAKKQIDALLVDHSMADLRDDLLDLADYIVDKLVPTDHSVAKQREHQLAVAMNGNLTIRNFMEYTNVFDRIVGSSDDAGTDDKPRPLLNGVDDITNWINTFQSPNAISRKHALDRWKATKSLPWLIAALDKTEQKDADSNLLLDAAAKIDSSSRAFATVSYEAAALLVHTGQCDKARNTIDKVLADKGLDLSSRNLLLALRLQVERNVDEFVANSQTKSVGTGGDDDQPYDATTKQKPDISPTAKDMYDNTIPLSIIKAASESKLYTADNRLNMAKTGWVRAILVDNEPIATALATALVKTDKAYARDYNAYLQAKNAAEKKFAAAFVILKHDDASPSFSHANGWWWSGYSTNDADTGERGTSVTTAKDTTATPLFLSKHDRDAARAEVAKLKKIPGAPAYLGAIVVSWAKAHPKDSRVPEALHLVVRSTRYGDRSPDSAKLSKEAFLILHHSYAANHWTAETPYYY